MYTEKKNYKKLKIEKINEAESKLEEDRKNTRIKNMVNYKIKDR